MTGGFLIADLAALLSWKQSSIDGSRPVDGVDHRSADGVDRQSLGQANPLSKLKLSSSPFIVDRSDSLGFVCPACLPCVLAAASSHSSGARRMDPED